MAYPVTIDSFTNPVDANKQNSPNHATQHSAVNDAVEFLEAKVGVNSSAVTTSHDYKLSEVTGADKAVGKSATQTFMYSNGIINSDGAITQRSSSAGTVFSGNIYFDHWGQVMSLDGGTDPTFNIFQYNNVTTSSDRSMMV